MKVIGSSNLVWGGLVIFLLAGVAAVAAVAVAGVGVPAGTAMLAGCLTLFAGVAMTFAAITAGTGPVFLAGTVVAGIGFGLAFLGAFEMVTALAPPAERAWSRRRRLYRELRRIQHPRGDRRVGRNPLRPSPDGPGVLRGGSCARRGGGCQSDGAQPRTA